MKVFHFVVLAFLFALTGCATDQLKPVLENLSHDCVRHYTGSVGGVLGTATIAFDISCTPGGTTTTTTVTTPKPAGTP